MIHLQFSLFFGLLEFRKFKNEKIGFDSFPAKHLNDKFSGNVFRLDSHRRLRMTHSNNFSSDKKTQSKPLSFKVNSVF